MPSSGVAIGHAAQIDARRRTSCSWPAARTTGPSAAAVSRRSWRRERARRRRPLSSSRPRPSGASRTRSNHVRVGRVAANDRQRHLGARRAAQQAHARDARHVARRLAVDHPHVSRPAAALLWRPAIRRARRARAGRTDASRRGRCRRPAAARVLSMALTSSGCRNALDVSSPSVRPRIAPSMHLVDVRPARHTPFMTRLTTSSKTRRWRDALLRGRRAAVRR